MIHKEAPKPHEFVIDEVAVTVKVVPVTLEQLMEYAEFHRVFLKGDLPALTSQKTFFQLQKENQLAAADLEANFKTTLGDMNVQGNLILEQLKKEEPLKQQLIDDLELLIANNQFYISEQDSGVKQSISTILQSLGENQQILEKLTEAAIAVEDVTGVVSSFKQKRDAFILDRQEETNLKTRAAAGNFNEYIRHTYSSDILPEGFDERTIVTADLSALREIGGKDYDDFPDLRYVDLSGSQVEGVIFRQCIMSHAILCDTDLSKTSFPNCNLSGTDFRGANVKGANFYGWNDDGAISDKELSSELSRFSFADKANLAKSRALDKSTHALEDTISTINHAPIKEVTWPGASGLRGYKMKLHSVSREMLLNFIELKKTKPALTLNQFVNPKESEVAISFIGNLDGIDFVKMGNLSSCHIASMPISRAEIDAYQNYKDEYSFVEYISELKGIKPYWTGVWPGTVTNHLTFDVSAEDVAGLELPEGCKFNMIVPVTQADIAGFQANLKINPELNFSDYMIEAKSLNKAATLTFDLKGLDIQGLDFNTPNFLRCNFNNIPVKQEDLTEYQAVLAQLQASDILPQSFAEFIEYKHGLAVDQDSNSVHIFDLQGENVRGIATSKKTNQFQGCYFTYDPPKTVKEFNEYLLPKIDSEGLDPTYIIGSSAADRSREIVVVNVTKADLHQYVIDCCSSTPPSKSFLQFIQESRNIALDAGKKFVPTLTDENGKLGENISDFDFKNGDFGGCNFANSSFVGARGAGAKFNQGACLENVIFDGAVLINCSFESANMFSTKIHNSTLDSCSMVRANFVEGNLYRTTVTNSNLDFMNLEDGTLKRSALVQSTANFANLKGVTASHAQFKQLQARGIILEKAVIDHVKIIGGDFTGALMGEIQLVDVSIGALKDAQGQVMELCKMDKVDAARAEMSRVLIEDTGLGGANLRSAILEQVKIKNSSLNSVTLDRVDAHMVNIQDSFMEKSTALQAHLDEFIMTNVQARGLNLSDAIIGRIKAEQGTDLTDAIMRGISAKKLELRGAVINGLDLRDIDEANIIFENVQAERLKLQGSRLNGEAVGDQVALSGEIDAGTSLAVGGVVQGEMLNVDTGEKRATSELATEGLEREEARKYTWLNSGVGQALLKVAVPVGDKVANICTRIAKFCREKLMSNKTAAIVGAVVGAALVIGFLVAAGPYLAMAGVGLGVAIGVGALAVAACSALFYKLNEWFTPTGSTVVGAAAGAALGAAVGMPLVGAALGAGLDVVAQHQLGGGLGNVVAMGTDLIGAGARRLSDGAEQAVAMHDQIVIQDKAREAHQSARLQDRAIEDIAISNATIVEQGVERDVHIMHSAEFARQLGNMPALEPIAKPPTVSQDVAHLHIPVDLVQGMTGVKFQGNIGTAAPLMTNPALPAAQPPGVGTSAALTA
jgi:uncharacterized protein YjbI with pentapeptide repeats